jgi:hypothetical protein
MILSIVIEIITDIMESSGIRYDAVGIVDMIFAILIIWPSLAVQAKRWHDLDKSAWWICINFIPILGSIWAFIELGFRKGTAGENRFDPDTLQSAIPADSAGNEEKVLFDLEALAGIYSGQGKYAEAERIYKRALEAGEKAIDHYRQFGKEAEAEKLGVSVEKIRSLIIGLEGGKVR